MATWSSLVARVQTDLADPTGVFHTTAAVRRYLEQAELLLSLRRSLYERTQTLTLTPVSPLYVIHSFFPDFVRPLRVTIGGTALRWSSLAAVGRLNRQWYREMQEAESVFMVGRTILGFAPLADATSAEVTYLAAPPTTVSTPAAGTSPVIGSEWHQTMTKFAEAVALGKESSYARAAEALKEFLALVGVVRDKRFLEGLAQKPATPTREPERRAND